MAEFVRHEPCEECGSKDNKAVYSDGSTYCFGCKATTRGDGGDKSLAKASPVDWTPLRGEYEALAARRLTRETCEFWQYQVGYYQGEKCHIANFRDERGRLVCQKLRTSGKQFLALGETKNKPLYGRWLWGSGKYLTITEGELDALSVSQAMDNKWPVVSLPDGVQSAAKVLAANYEWLDKFECIVLMFDMDDPGRAAVEEAATVLPIGKVKIAKLPEKDANEVLVKHGPAALVKAFWNASEWRPDGIRTVAELREEFFNPPPIRGIPWPWEEWNDVAKIMRIGALHTFTAGTGIGKTTAMVELAYWCLTQQSEPVGVMFMEDDTLEVMERLVGVHISKNVYEDRALASPEELEQGYAFLESKPLYVYDHFGSSEVDNICAKIRYLVKACGVRWVFLDHISILVSGLEGDERRTIDIAMTKLRTLVNELKIGLFVVVHLRRPQGDKGHEDGAEVHLGQLRGSHSIAQLSDIVIGFQKPEDDPHGTTIEPIVLKNRRNGGRKGPMGILNYDRQTGRLSNNVL